MDTIREVIATLFLAMAYAGGPHWLERANDVLVENANDPEIDGEAAHILRTLSNPATYSRPQSATALPCWLITITKQRWCCRRPMKN
jgi:hypothetical protein